MARTATTGEWAITLKLNTITRMMKSSGDLTVAKLAAQASVSRNSLGDALNKGVPVTARMVARLAAILDCQPHEISEWRLHSVAA